MDKRAKHTHGIDRSVVASLRKAWDDICAKPESQPDTTDLDRLARRFDILSGKWLVFVSQAQVDAVWSRVASATHAGTLGTSAKVSPRSDDSNGHVICVFTRDYTDASDVNKVRDGLRRLRLRDTIGYKPDVYTYCHVYQDNPWNIFPTRYRQ